MRHRSNRLLKIRGSVQSRDLTMRTMLTNLVRYNHLTTTEKKAKVLIAYADNFFARLVSMNTQLDQSDAQRESIRLVKSRVFGNDEGRKVIREILPKLLTTKKQSGFLSGIKLGRRVGDAAEQVRIEFTY